MSKIQQTNIAPKVISDLYLKSEKGECFSDKNFPNLVLRRQTQGMSFEFRKMIGGIRHVITLGKYPELTIPELLMKYHEKFSQLQNGTFSQGITVDELINKHQAEIKSRCRLSFKLNSRDLAIHKYFKGLKISDVTYRDLMTFIESLEGIKPSTRNRYIASLKSLFKAALRLGYINQNPAALLRFSHERPNAYIALTETQIPVFVKEAHLDNNFIHGRALLLALFSGLRIGNVIELKRQQINFEQKTITIAEQKNGTQLVIPLNSQAIEVLREVLATNNDEYVFPGDTLFGHIHYPREAMERISKRMLKAGVIHQRITIHSLRHTFATVLYNSCSNIVTVQRLLGHKSSHTTLRYARSSVESLRNASEQVFKPIKVTVRAGKGAKM